MNTLCHLSVVFEELAKFFRGFLFGMPSTRFRVLTATFTDAKSEKLKYMLFVIKGQLAWQPNIY